MEGGMKKIDIQGAPVSAGSRYPEPFARPCRNKLRRRLAVAAGLKHIGINLLELDPGAWSSQRHWHSEAEEFVYVLEGEVVLVTERGEETLRAGDCAAFLPGDPARARNRIGRHPQRRDHLSRHRSAGCRIPLLSQGWDAVLTARKRSMIATRRH